MYKSILITLLLNYMGNALPQNGGNPAEFTPPDNFAGPIVAVRKRLEERNPNFTTFKNFNWDQIVANDGKLNYCVRWDSKASVTAAERDSIHENLAQEVKRWNDVMVGHNGWPYKEIPVKVVGWAVRDRSQLKWEDKSVDIYVNNIRENAPQCDEKCGRFFNQNGDYSKCPGGAERHYDQSLWLTGGMGGGAGGDWGQRLGAEYLLNGIKSGNVAILTHEIGHTYGLDDFYDFNPIDIGFLMKAGSANVVTDFDAWMLRDSYNHLKSRYANAK